MDSIDKADMNGWLNRIAMAKMLSQYAMNILWKKAANTVVPNFPDISEKLNEDYNWAVTLAYQLGIMWIGIDKFRPYDWVTRAEFATALSRMLYGLEDGNPYYATHLAKLKTEWIITNDNPNLKEIRWYVMIMLMRSNKTDNNKPQQEITENNDTNTFHTEIVRTWNIADYRNEEYGFQFTLPETWNDCSIAHQQSINKETNKIESESFQLICPREWLKQDANSYIPDWYDRLIDLIVIWPDTDEWTLNSVSDQKLIENNKYKFWFGISDASKDIFNWKVNPSDLECWKYPNCTCLEKQN